eukprot:426733_1
MLQRCHSFVKHRPFILQRASFCLSAQKKANCAVLLSGCGVYDGSEIQESTAILFSLSKRANVQCFAPNINQMHVVNHTDGTEMDETRNVLIESARICRGNIKDIKELNADDYHCLLVPGGFGAAKNLCSFAVDGADMKVNDEVEKVVQDFHNKSKPMGFTCIAPVIPSKVFGQEHSVAVTVGSDQDNENGDWPYAGTAQAIETMGAKHVVRGPTQTHVDDKNKIVTSPAYMYNGEPREIYDSVLLCVTQFLHL